MSLPQNDTWYMQEQNLRQPTTQFEVAHEFKLVWINYQFFEETVDLHENTANWAIQKKPKIMMINFPSSVNELCLNIL